jgi:predicted nucleic acid-binding Zn ribbon protein
VTRRSAPRPISDSVRALRADVAPATLLGAVQDRWDEAVGERIAAEARPVREREGTVTVECRAATWAQELDLLQGELLEALNSALAGPGVAALRFVVGDGNSRDPL